jgi:hypothetical protein
MVTSHRQFGGAVIPGFVKGNPGILASTTGKKRQAGKKPKERWSDHIKCIWYFTYFVKIFYSSGKLETPPHICSRSCF